VRVVAQRGGDEIADGRPGRQWRLDLADRVLLVAAYWRTNLTMRQIGPLFGVSHSAAHRVIDTLGPLLALAPVRRRRIDQVAIVDGTLIPTRDHRLAAPSKNYRYSTNLQVAIDADTRLVIATGDPQPGNRNDCTVYRASGIDRKLAGRPVMADPGYQGNPEVIMPYRKRTDGTPFADWRLGSLARSGRFASCWRIARRGPAQIFSGVGLRFQPVVQGVTPSSDNTNFILFSKRTERADTRVMTWGSTRSAAAVQRSTARS
jgi:hypothetical protein